MKNRIQTLLNRGLLALGMSVTLASAPAFAENIYAIGYSGGPDQIIRFSSSAPSTILGAVFVSGLQPLEQLMGLDSWNGVIFGVGSFGRLYTVNGLTGVATAVGSGFSALSGSSFGVENDTSGIRVVSDLDQNLLVNRTTGGLISSGPDMTPTSLRIDALAWNPANFTMYAIDSSANTFGTANLAAGTFTSLGALGIDVSRNNGFNISSNGVAYLGSPATSGDPQANLYSVNLTTGAATLIGQIGAPGDNWLVRGLTTDTVVPEPGSMTLLALGGLGVLTVLRRRK